MCKYLKYCLQLVVFGIWIIVLLALFCSLKINFAFVELPQNINPYNNKDWKYAWYKVWTVSNQNTLLTTHKPEHILHSFFASSWVCIVQFRFSSSQTPKNFKHSKCLMTVLSNFIERHLKCTFWGWWKEIAVVFSLLIINMLLLNHSEFIYCFIDLVLNNVNSVRFEVFTSVTMKNAIFWDVTPCGSCKNQRFGGT
jgi:hypothetical protein